MSRQRTGSAYVKDGVIVIAVNLRPGPDGKARRFVTRCPARPDSVPVDLIHARAVAADLQRRYDAGQWDPDAPLPATPSGAVPASSGSPVATQEPTAASTVLSFARTWIKTQRYESAPSDAERIERYLAKAPLGEMLVGGVRAKHILAFIRWLEDRPSERGGTLAPRTVRNAYDIVRRALDAAVIEELLAVNPCHAVHGRLPSIEDKVPGARQGWIYTREEITALTSDPRVPLPRRVAYALQFCTGCRFGELAALRWRDYDSHTPTLGRLTIARAVKSVSKREAQTKTGAIKTAPVHPALALVLEAWRSEGWRAFQGREPEPDDLILPNQHGRMRDGNRHNRDLGRDCAKLGLRHRHAHCLRHTFISLTQEDGGDGSVIRWVTHAPPRTAFDGYTRQQWSRLCAEVAKLRVVIAPPLPSATKAIAPASATMPELLVVTAQSYSGFIVGARGFEDCGEGREVSPGAENCSDSVQGAGHQATLSDASATPLATIVADGMTWTEEVTAVCADIRERAGVELARALKGFLVALNAAVTRGDHARAEELLGELTARLIRDESSCAG